jgi:hypothetical protein
MKTQTFAEILESAIVASVPVVVLVTVAAFTCVSVVTDLSLPLRTEYVTLGEVPVTTARTRESVAPGVIQKKVIFSVDAG